MKLEQKVKASDVIIRAKVVKLDDVVGDDTTKGSWKDPTKVATLELLQTYHKVKGVKVLAKFKVYCGFQYHESPDLTEGREYFMFLRHVKGNEYEPVGIATMHPIYEKRVLKFGMDHSKDLFKDFEGRSTKLADWVAKVAKAFKAKNSSGKVDSIVSVSAFEPVLGTKVTYEVLSECSLKKMESKKMHVRISEYVRLLSESKVGYKLKKILIEGDQVLALSKGEDGSYLVKLISDECRFKVIGGKRTRQCVYIKSVSPKRASISFNLGRIYQEGEKSFDVKLKLVEK